MGPPRPPQPYQAPSTANHVSSFFSKLLNSQQTSKAAPATNTRQKTYTVFPTRITVFHKSQNLQLHSSKLLIMASPEKPPPAIFVQPVSPRFPKPGPLTAGTQRKVAIAVDLSDESAYAVNWAVQNYLRPGDSVILLHVRPTSVLYGADWGVVEDPNTATDEESQQKLEDDFDAFTTTKANDLAKPLVDSQINFKIHIVKDHDMKERLCLEVERLGLSAVIMGSRGFGASRRTSKAQRLGSVSDYCVHHCVCPVVVVRYPDDKDGGTAVGSPLRVSDKNGGGEGLLHPVPEEEPEFHDAFDKQTDLDKPS